MDGNGDPLPHPSDIADAYVRRRAAVHGAQRRTEPYTAVRGPQSSAPATVLDIAWDRPSVAQIQATGAVGVARYFSPDPSKNLTASEVGAYTLAGLSTVTVFESTAGRALAGYGAGQSDARLAESQRLACGLPSTHPVHMAVDTDTTWSSVQAYFEGAASVLGIRRTGCYGGVKVITGAHGYGLRYLWQTVAWSAGQVSPYTTLYQNGGTALGGQADINHVLVRDYGQYPPDTGADVITPADLPVLVNTDNVLAAPPDASDIATNKFWTWGSHIVATTTAARAANTRTAAMSAKLDSALASLATALSDLDDVKAAVASITSTGLTPAQVAAIAKAVNDDAAKRLES